MAEHVGEDVQKGEKGDAIIMARASCGSLQEICPLLSASVNASCIFSAIGRPTEMPDEH